MIKILKNVFNDEELNEILKDFNKKKELNCWNFSNFSWSKELYEEGICGQVSFSMTSSEVGQIIANKIKHLIPTSKFLMTQHFLWNSLSGINEHDDTHYTFGATLYLNKNWNINWGGLFLYKEENEWKAIVPEFNTIVFNFNYTDHLVTLVSPTIKEPRQTVQIWGLN